MHYGSLPHIDDINILNSQFNAIAIDRTIVLILIFSYNEKHNYKKYETLFFWYHHLQTNLEHFFD